ncbi:tetratricopeptide repeat protein [Desulfovibrio sp. JC022]|uniref:tetratricopeptide repeat protein n=1 Tax=Desulfovibrio sp. JC022 TaxID=2593642 RepID=UPI0013D7D789|nr:tetratricopeptide repeat protein [Desulfovibrio sp. JC022]NDV23002.1 tetratricopeptide repeat protein [Desulfovibrio sp. JC022]
MSDKKKAQKLSRRGFLFGGFRKKEDREQIQSAAKPIAAKEVNLDTLAEANVAYENSRFEEAATKYKEFIKTEPQNADARKRLGHCLYKNEKYVQAKVEFERAIRILGKDNFSYLYLGLLLCRAGAGKKAVPIWKLYFDPENITLQREINLQIALIESDPEASFEDAANMVEQVIEETSMQA